MENTVAEMQISYTPKFAYPTLILTKLKDIVGIFRELFDKSQLTVREECIVLFLNQGNKITGSYKVSSGGITGTIVDIRLILGIALKSLSTNIILAHSHPSGNAKPSTTDLALTARLKEAAWLLDIRLMDHVIISSDSYYSFAEEGNL